MAVGGESLHSSQDLALDRVNLQQRLHLQGYITTLVLALSELNRLFMAAGPAHLVPVLHLALGAAVGDHLALAAALHSLSSSLLGLRPGGKDTVHTLLGCHGLQI